MWNSNSEALDTRKTTLGLVFHVSKARAVERPQKATYRCLGGPELMEPVLLVPPAA